MARLKTTRRPRTVYKKAFYIRHNPGYLGITYECIITLEIPANTRVRLSTSGERKCRAACAITKHIQYMPNNQDLRSLYQPVTVNEFQKKMPLMYKRRVLYMTGRLFIV